MTNTDGWTVRKVAREMRPGERFIFAEDIGGEGEVVTVVSAADALGTTAIETEELDFDIEVLSKHMLTMAPPDDDRPGITLTRGQLEAWAGFTLTDAEVEALDEALPNSSIPEAICTIAEQLHEEEGDV